MAVHIHPRNLIRDFRRQLRITCGVVDIHQLGFADRANLHSAFELIQDQSILAIRFQIRIGDGLFLLKSL
ncbi:Uncharacterised protein [Vibrio cholerae]|nr:Uncharacterised protein [Vibrio cholerae]CSA88778.1 Uncharacterised protein [Vibrio cholerae]CSB04800.1 Uncharacterised protein [Vibrio cholerae]